MRKDVSATVWVVKEWYAWPFAWLMAGRRYVRDLDEIIDVIEPIVSDGRRLKSFHVLSHGNLIVAPASGVPQGTYIDLGEGDQLRSDDLDGTGVPRSGTATASFVAALKAAMRPGGRLVFSACRQGEGALLRGISGALGNDIVVSGYRRLGHPFGSGDIAFRNGIRIR